MDPTKILDLLLSLCKGNSYALKYVMYRNRFISSNIQTYLLTTFLQEIELSILKLFLSLIFLCMSKVLVRTVSNYDLTIIKISSSRLWKQNKWHDKPVENILAEIISGDAKTSLNSPLILLD